MAMSIQTNVNSLVAQENLRVNNNFQSQTIQRITSGFRINQSGDDAAGLAVANRFRSNTAELTQGVRNANDGVSQLQIIDGGLSNISQMLDRMKTLATQSASSTFTGDRTTLNNEYQALIGEIDRQAANVGLNTGGTYNTSIGVYIGGGGGTQNNSQITIDLSGNANAVDATGLGVKSTNLLGAGTAVGGSKDLSTNGNILAGNAAGLSQVFHVHLAGGGGGDVTVKSTGTAGLSANDALQQLNNGLSSYGLSAYIDTSNSGKLTISGSKAFTVTVDDVVGGAGAGFTGAGANVENSSMYRIDQTSGTTKTATTWTQIAATDQEVLTFTAGGKTQTFTLNNGNTATATAAATALNTALSSLGINAVVGENGTGVAFESSSTFSVSSTGALKIADGSAGTAAGVFGSNATVASENAVAPAASTAGQTGNALSALTSISNAVSNLGLVQGRVGAGENKLSYAINLAQSQITNYSAAESRIRDADIASEAANLTKAQVLQQASMAAMAQANSAPQQVLSLLRG